MRSFIICFYFILTFKIMYLYAWEGHSDRNLQHVLTRVIKFAVPDGSTYIRFDIYKLYCTANIIKQIKRIWMKRGRGPHFC